jgi:hypothetical protein
MDRTDQHPLYHQASTRCCFNGTLVAKSAKTCCLYKVLSMISFEPSLC